MSIIMDILIFIDYFLPGFKGGGPLKTIYNLSRFAYPEIKSSIITSDCDLNDKVPYSKQQISSISNKLPSKIYYLNPNNVIFFKIYKLLQVNKTKIIFLNSIFSVKFTLPILILQKLQLIERRNIILAVRGELDQNALKIKKWLKKIYLVFIKRFSLLNGIVLLATSDKELYEIKGKFPEHHRIEILEDIPNYSNIELTKKKFHANHLDLIFISRIVPIKNLDLVLKYLKNVKYNVKLSIYGPIENQSYWQKCLELKRKLASNIVVKYFGEIRPEDVPRIFQKHNYLILLSQSENFAHVIYEALQSGTPVVISENTPWIELNNKSFGWVCNYNNQIQFLDILNELNEINEIKYDKISLEAYSYAKNRIDVKVIINKYIEFFSKLTN